MITVEKLETLNGDTIINTKDIIAINDLGELITGDGRVVTIDGTTIGGGTGGGTVDPDPDPDPVLTTTYDEKLEILPSVIDNLQNNVVELIQDTEQPGWSKFQPVIEQVDFSLETAGAGSMAVSEINFSIRDAGYQIVKIELFNGNDKIEFLRKNSNTLTLKTNSSIDLNIASNGFMLVDNATYELANVFNTEKPPVQGTGGWFSLTANTDASASFQAVFSIPISITNAKIYRCGANSTTFNSGSGPYDIEFIDNSETSKIIEVPKLSNDAFLNISNAVSASLSIDSEPIDIEIKKHTYGLRYSLDGTNFVEISPISEIPKQNAETGLWSVSYIYDEIVIGVDNQRKLYINLPDNDIQQTKNLKIDTWYLE